MFVAPDSIFSSMEKSAVAMAAQKLHKNILEGKLHIRGVIFSINYPSVTLTGIFSPLAWDLWFGIFRLESLAWDLLLGIFGLRSFAWDLSLGVFCL